MINITNGNIALPMSFAHISNVEGTTTFNDKKLITKGELGIQYLKEHPQWGNQIQLSIFTTELPILEKRKMGKWCRHELYFNVAQARVLRDTLNVILGEVKNDD